MDREKTVVLVTVSPLEVHGPHLPLVADVLEGDAMLLRTVERVSEKRREQGLEPLDFVHLTPLGMGAQVLPQPGSLPFEVRTVERVVYELGRALAAQGFVEIWVGNFHGAPGHFLALERAADRCNRRFGTRMVSLFSLVLGELNNERAALDDGGLRGLLGEVPGIPWERLAGDAHAGAIETSLLLHLVEEAALGAWKRLPRRTFELRRAERGDKPLEKSGLVNLARDFLDKLAYFSEETYAGDPALASAEAGAHVLDRIAELGAASLLRVLSGEVRLVDCHSPLWRRRWLFLNPLVTRVFDAHMRSIVRRRSAERPPNGTG